MEDKGDLRSLVLKSKYGGEEGVGIKRVSNADSIWWRDIVHVWGRRWRCHDLIKTSCGKWGTGKKLSFWNNTWVGNEALIGLEITEVVYKLYAKRSSGGGLWVLGGGEMGMEVDLEA